MITNPRLLMLLAATALLPCLLPATAAARPRPPATTTVASSANTARLTGRLLLAPGAGYDTRNGSALVRALQRRLLQAGDRPGPIDGRYGPETEHAVARFQAAHGLAVDGRAGRATLKTLTAAVAILYPGAGLAQPGGSGAVRGLQRRLAALGFAPGPIDGRDGPLTTHAVIRFQAAHGLLVDGIVGVQTWRALRAARRHASAAKRPHARPAVGRQLARPGRPVASTHRVGHPSTKQKRVPALPVGLVLLGLVALGVATASVSYARTRAQVRRARANPRPANTRPARAPIGAASPPAPPRAPRDSLVAEHQGSER